MKKHIQNRRKVRVSFAVFLSAEEFRSLEKFGRECGFGGKSLHVIKNILRRRGEGVLMSLDPKGDGLLMR